LHEAAFKSSTHVLKAAHGCPYSLCGGAISPLLLFEYIGLQLFPVLTTIVRCVLLRTTLVLVWRQLLLRIDDNYFSGSTTISSGSRRREAAVAGRWAKPAPRSGFSFFRDRELVAVGKWETCFWFSTFPSALVAGAVGMWESCRFLARFPRGSWKEGKACLWLSTLSTAPPFPQLSSVPWALGSAGCGTSAPVDTEPALFFFLLLFSR
jgi:hypothetical protein